MMTIGVPTLIANVKLLLTFIRRESHFWQVFEPSKIIPNASRAMKRRGISEVLETGQPRRFGMSVFINKILI
jgi:hypothetical protein